MAIVRGTVGAYQTGEDLGIGVYLLRGQILYPVVRVQGTCGVELLFLHIGKGPQIQVMRQVRYRTRNRSFPTDGVRTRSRVRGSRPRPGSDRGPIPRSPRVGPWDWSGSAGPPSGNWAEAIPGGPIRPAPIARFAGQRTALSRVLCSLPSTGSAADAGAASRRCNVRPSPGGLPAAWPF